MEHDPRSATQPDGARRIRVLVAATIETDATDEAVRLVLADDLRDGGYAVEAIHVAEAATPASQAEQVARPPVGAAAELLVFAQDFARTCHALGLDDPDADVNGGDCVDAMAALLVHLPAIAKAAPDTIPCSGCGDPVHDDEDNAHVGTGIVDCEQRADAKAVKA